MRHVTALAALTTLVVTTTGACSSNEVERAGPLTFGSEPTEEKYVGAEFCAPLRPDHPRTFSLNNGVIRNIGDEPVTITKADLVESTNVELIAAELHVMPTPMRTK